MGCSVKLGVTEGMRCYGDRDDDGLRNCMDKKAVYGMNT
jgi:hypothetical protein